MNQIITKETINRLLKDVKHIIKHPLTDNGIYYVHDDTDMLKGYALIIGPTGTPYFGGYYFFTFDFPTDYPYSPPKVTFMTNDGYIRYNPNLYRNGRVCISILNTWEGEKWSCCQNINTILLTLCSLLNESPLENEPGYCKTDPEFIPYQTIIEYANINYAICDIINPSTNRLPEHFTSIFYSIMLEHFYNNIDKLIEFVQSKNNYSQIVSIQLYKMDVYVNYPKLYNKLIKTKILVEENEKKRIINKIK